MEFIKKIIIYAIGNVSSKLIIFLLLPFYTKYFNPGAYGDNDLAVSTAIMITSLLFMEIWTALLRFSYDEETTCGKYKMFSNVLMISAGLLPIYFIGSLAIGIWQNLPNIIWMLMFGLSLLILNIFQYCCRALGKSRDFVVSGVLSSIIQLVSSLVLIFIFKMDAVVLIISPTVGYCISSVYLELKCHLLKNFQIKYRDKKLIRLIILYSFPLSINSIAFWAMTNVSKYFVRYSLGSEANGYISLATKFTSLIAVLVGIYNMAWQESAYEHSNDSDRTKYYNYMMNIFIDLICAGTCVVILGINVVFPYLIDSHYEFTQKILPLYFVSSWITALGTFVGYIYTAEKKTNILLYSTVLGSLVNIILLVSLINILGIWTVPIALIIGSMVNSLMRFKILQKAMDISIKINSLVWNLIIIGVTLAVTYCFDQSLVKVMAALFILLALMFKYRTSIEEIIKFVTKR